MQKFKIYFEFFGKNLVTVINAYSMEEAIEILKERININKSEILEDTLDKPGSSESFEEGERDPFLNKDSKKTFDYLMNTMFGK